jgi:hypothetical protein
MDLPQQGLISRITTAQREALNAFVIKLDFAADQAVRPQWINRNSMAEQADMAVIVGAPEIDQAASQRDIKVQLPFGWKGSARGRLLGTQGVASAMGPDIAGGMGVQGGQTGKGEALPHLGLPQPVETLNRVLQAMFQGRRKHRDDAERQTESADAADGVGELMGALESGVVVELRVGGQTQLYPALDEPADYHGSAQLSLRPGIDLPPMDGHCRKDTKALPTAQGQVFDQVEAIQIDARTGERRQVPARRRRRPALPPGSVLRSVAFENPVNGRHGGDLPVNGTQFRVDGFGAEFSEQTVVTQPPPHFKDGAFGGEPNSIPGELRSPLPILETDPIQPAPNTSRHPLADRCRADRKAARNRTHRFSLPHRLHHHLTTPFKRAFLDTMNSRNKAVTLSGCPPFAET